MATIYIEPIQESGEVLQLVRSAIESEIAKLELALKMAMKRLTIFEEKYGVSLEHFIAEMTVEDLERGFRHPMGVKLTFFPGGVHSSSVEASLQGSTLLRGGKRP